MGLGLSHYFILRLANEAKLTGSLVNPMLVWEAPVGMPEEALLLATQATNVMDRPRIGEPLVYELVKGNAKQNAFAMGITLGRTENNDVVIEDHSISRFHAYFMKDAKTQAWKVVDADSRNGTWVGPLKLSGNKPEPVSDRVKLRFGEVELRYFEPASFLEFLTQKGSE